MKTLPNSPFLTEDFSLKSGGVDFLGLRWVGLTMVGRELIPEINNVTSDMGTFFLGAWIPWKFRQLCLGAKDYTEKNYKVFREKVEVALSLTLQDSELPRKDGLVRNRIGITQQCSLPAALNFKNAKRTDKNSLFAAAIYGPSLRALGLIKVYHSQALNGRDSLNIPIAGEDDDTIRILEGVDESLKSSKSFPLLGTLDSPPFDWQQIRRLGERGLDPARFRGAEFRTLQSCFRRKLLPKDPDEPGYFRTLTARLLLETVNQRAKMFSTDVRIAWYTGRFDDGRPLRIKDAELANHQQRWSCFMARQYQRYVIELFLWCFEDALKQGSRSVEEVVDYWVDRSTRATSKLDGSFRKVLKACAGPLWKGDDDATSAAWNTQVHGAHDQYEFIENPQDEHAISHGLSMLAGWYWRMLSQQGDAKTTDLMRLGGSDRMSIAWFLRWLTDRRDLPIREFLTEIFSDLIFAQHMRIALARFDGSAQRLRFLLGDTGIEPTTSARADLGQLRLPWMPDRLDTLIGLLCDCDVLNLDAGHLRHGSHAADVSA
jgi:hypothetical protein